MKERCPACRGAKQVMKLGMIHGDCTTCKGTGQVEKVTTVFTMPETKEVDSFIKKEPATELKEELYGKKKKHRD